MYIKPFIYIEHKDFMPENTPVGMTVIWLFTAVLNEESACKIVHLSYMHATYTVNK